MVYQGPVLAFPEFTWGCILSRTQQPTQTSGRGGARL